MMCSASMTASESCAAAARPAISMSTPAAGACEGSVSDGLADVAGHVIVKRVEPSFIE